VEIMEKMGWQRHTVRGFVAGALKTAGYSVESFKSEGGERTYRTGKKRQPSDTAAPARSVPAGRSMLRALSFWNN